MRTCDRATLEPYREPSNEPKSAQTIRPAPCIDNNSKRNLPDTTFDISPEMEFKQVNAAAVAEVVLGSAQRQSTSKGLRKTPPPIPIAPDISPSTKDEIKSKGRRGGVSNLSSLVLLLKNKRRNATKNSTTPSTVEYCCSSILNMAPIYADGTETATIGKVSLSEKWSALWYEIQAIPELIALSTSAVDVIKSGCQSVKDITARKPVAPPCPTDA